MLPSAIRAPDERIGWRSSAPFIACQFVPLAAFVTGVSRSALALGVVFYFGRMLFITAGYHRYFAHRSFRLGRAAQFVVALGGLTAAQKGPLWWASQHRDHHRYADTDRDPHSPHRGFWWSHVGWILSGKYGATDYEAIDDFAKYPELRFLDRHDWIGPWALAILSFVVAGWSGLVVGFFASTVALWHATFSVNSFAHLFGRRKYATPDTSRNSVAVALATLGEGWHNNHHHYPASARQGFRWWEVDPTFTVLRVLAWVGIVRDLRQPPATARKARRVRDGHPDLGTLRQHLSRAATTISRARPGLPAGMADDLVARLSDIADSAAASARSLRRERQVERSSPT